MNTVVTSSDAILKECRNLVMTQGISAINMRTVAAACNIAVGSLYNYFPSKVDLINATIEDVWKDIFHMSGQVPSFHSFPACLHWLFESIQNGCAKYPGFFTFHSMHYASKDKDKGKAMMERTYGHIKESLMEVLNQDQRIRSDAFDDTFSRQKFIDMIFTLFMSSLLHDQPDCDALIIMVERCLY